MFAIHGPEGATSPSSPLSVSSSGVSGVSDTSRTKSAFLIPAPTVLPLPAYVAFAAASQLATDNHIQNIQQQTSDGSQQTSPQRSGALFTEQALALINAFLDELLYSFLCNARSMSLLHLETAVENVLKGKLAQLALDSAHNELEDLLAEEDDVEPPGTPSGDDALSQEEIDLVFKRSRLRVMVYMRLGEMEDEDEERYVKRELDVQGARSSKRFSNTSRMVPWSAAIFLTSVLEFIAEQCIACSGENAYRRVKQRQTNQATGLSKLDADMEERVYVDEHDVEKLALNSILTRLWRIWRKNLRSRPKSRLTVNSITPQTRSLNDKESSATLRTESALGHNQDVKEIDHTIGSDSDNLPKQDIAVKTTAIPLRPKREELPTSEGTAEDSDSDALGQTALSHISEERSLAAEYSDSNNHHPALFPLTNRSSLHSHPAFDYKNYPPDIAVAAGLAPSARAVGTTLYTNDMDQTTADATTTQHAAHAVWASSVADRALSAPTIVPSENAFAAQARAADEAARNRSNTASTFALDTGYQSENAVPSLPLGKDLTAMDESKLQPSVDRKFSAGINTPPQDRQGSFAVVSPSSALTLSPGDSEYSPAPALGVASIAQEFQARSITPPRSRETLREQRSTPPIIKKPLKIPKNLTPKSSPADKSGGSGRRKSSLVAREAKIEDESIRDFADFIRSTAPTEDQTRIAPIIPPTAVHNITPPKTVSPPSSTSKPLPSLPRETTSRNGPKSPPTSSRGKKRQSILEPRDAIIRGHDTDDLVDFLREGPPGASVGDTSSVGNTPTSMSTGGRNGSVLTQQSRGSVTSSTALVNNAKSSRKSSIPMAQARSAQASPPVRSRPHGGDPYALPSSEDDTSDPDSDNLTALPGRRQVRRKSGNQSLIDFLQTANPPASNVRNSTIQSRNNISASTAVNSSPSAARRRYDAANDPTSRNTSSPPPRHPRHTKATHTHTHSRMPTNIVRAQSPNPTNVLSTSAFYTNPPSTSTTPPKAASAIGAAAKTSSPGRMGAGFVGAQQNRPIDLSELDRGRKMYGGLEDEDAEAAPSPTIMRDRGSKIIGGKERKGSGFWKRG